MNKLIKNAVLNLIRRTGFDIIKFNPNSYDQDSLYIYNIVKNYTMTGLERINAVVNAVKYIESAKIEGAFVECGVWKGGSTMAMALTLKILDMPDRDIYLYDTFAGMTEPSESDITYNGTPALEQFSRSSISSESSDWCAASLDEVKVNVFSTGYPKDKFHFVRGVVEKTIPDTLPEKIAILRLDTDWYESTRHELVHLFPLLSPGGVLIVDDYGHWQGAKKAVDEYINENHIRLLLNRIDYTGVIGVKSSI